VSAVREIKRYVLGYCMTPNGVMLIQKISPPQWSGRANAIGGKIQLGETPSKAMVREFREETGISTTEKQWQALTIIKGKPLKLNNYHEWIMYVFWTTNGSVPADYTHETEEGSVSIYKELPENLDVTARWLYLFLQEHYDKGIEIRPCCHHS